MNNRRLYVFDTNVIVSALLFHNSVPGQAFAHCLADGVILISQQLIEELSNVLQRKKFDRYLTQLERERFLGSLIHEAELVQVDNVVKVCRDPDDNRILELAISGRANCIVTGDDDLLALNPFRQIPIVTPATLLDQTNESATDDEVAQ